MPVKGRTISTVGYSLSVVEIAPGAVPSPNIWNTPQVYELENRAVDPDGVLAEAMRELRKLKKRKQQDSEPEVQDLAPAVRSETPDLDFPDELNLEYTPRQPGGDTDAPERTGLDETGPDLDRSASDASGSSDPASDTTILDGGGEGSEGVRKTDGDRTEAALAALVELAKPEAPRPDSEAPSDEADDRTEVLEHPRRRGFFRR